MDKREEQFKRMVLAYLHDPPHKVLDLGRHEEFAEPTRWSLLNAFTETAKKYSPARADQCYRSLTRLFGLDGKPAELWKR